MGEKYTQPLLHWYHLLYITWNVGLGVIPRFSKILCKGAPNLLKHWYV